MSLKLNAVVVESEGVKQFEKDGKVIRYQSVLARVGSLVYRFKTQPDLDFSKHVDKKVVFNCDLKRADAYAPVLHVTSVEQ